MSTIKKNEQNIASSSDENEKPDRKINVKNSNSNNLMDYGKRKKSNTEKFDQSKALADYMKH